MAEQEQQLSRVQPHSHDAERSILGGILIDETILGEVQLLVKAEDFHREQHRKIFEAMCALSAIAKPIDRVTVKAELQRVGAMTAADREDVVDLLDKVVPASTNARWYAEIVAEKALVRRTIEAAQAIVLEGYAGIGSGRDYVDRAEQRMFSLRTERAELGLHRAGDDMSAQLKTIQARGQRDSAITGEPSGLDALDHMTAGFQPGNLIIIAGRPSMGKSAFSHDCISSTCSAGGGAALFSLEMPRGDVIDRLLAREARIDSQLLRTGRLDDAQWAKIVEASGVVSNWELHVNDDAGVTVMEIRALARRIAKKLEGTKHPLKLIVVDYVQLMRGAGNRDNREGEVADMSRELKSLAKQLNVPVLALCQLNRELEKRPDKRPMMSDLRESGALEQDADLIVFPFREEVYDKNNDGLKGRAELIIGKQRNGPVGSAKVAFIKQYSSFRNLGDAVTGMRFDGPPPHSDEDNR